MDKDLTNPQTQFSTSFKPGDKIKFKTCARDFTCSNCRVSECRKLGNFDLDGYRFDTIKEIQLPYGKAQMVTNVMVPLEFVESLGITEPEDIQFFL